MKGSSSGRRMFIKNTATAVASLVTIPAIPSVGSLASAKAAFFIHPKPRIRFSVIGINHGHIYSQTETMIRAGGEFVSFYAKEPDLSAEFSKHFPQAKKVKSVEDILNDNSINLIVSAAIPDERASLGINVMRHGKDFLSDKPGVISLEQLNEVRRVQKETKRIYSILYGERLENKATLKAGELVKAGAIGKVIQTIGLGPHKMQPKARPEWFFHKKHFGGIITDIGAHQFDQFLYFTGSTKAEVVASQIGNFNHPQFPEIDDFGDAMIKGESCTGYMRVDWFTPEGLKSWGDSRLTVLGTEGYIEVRKNVDIGGRTGDSHLFLVNGRDTTYIDSSKVEVNFGQLLVDDILNRTETAMPQEHCFLAAELAIRAQQQAKKITG